MRLVAALVAVAVAAAAPAGAQQPPAGEMIAPRGNPMFIGMSPIGRAIMRAAAREADARTGREATGAARDRMLAVLDADRLDPIALRRAMDDEREAAGAAKLRQQTALIAGFQQLSLADRRIFVANARAVRQRIAERTPGLRQLPYGGMPPQ